MTISTVDNRKEYAGNGVTIAFATPPFIQDADIQAKLVNDTTGVAVDWVLATQYTLTGAGAAGGGTLTVNTSPTDYTPAVGETLVIYTDPALTQGTDLVDNDALPAETVEQSLDKLTIIAQRLRSLVDRAFVFSDDAVGTEGVSLSIPAPVASRLIGWNSSADALQLVSASDLNAVLTTAFTESLLDDADADAFWTTLMASINKANARTSFGASAVGDALFTTASKAAGRLAIGAASVSANGILAPHKNLVVKNGSTAASTMDVDADEIVLTDSSDNRYLASSVNLTIDITASGVNGLDTGSEAMSTWYHIWVIYNGTTVAGLLSTSSTSPTLPSGYTYKGYVGAVYNNSSSNFPTTKQKNNRVVCAQAADLTGGSAGTPTAVSVTVPTTAVLWSGWVNAIRAGGSSALALISSDSSDTGVVRVGMDGADATVDPKVYAPVSILLVTAQTIYYTLALGTGLDIRTTGWGY